MPRQIICKAEIETEAPVKVCGSPFFENVVQLMLLSPIESKTGGPELQMAPGFRCAECGAVLDVNQEVNQSQASNKINGIFKNG